MISRRQCLLALAGCALPRVPWAAPRPIPPAYHWAAARGGVPAALLFAIALQESGLAAPALPWPWTLNLARRPYRAASRHQAEAVLLAWLGRGRRQVDIGLCQVNWRYHAHRFPSAAAALDPYRNLRVAADILREHYRACGDWWLAAGRYHAPADAAAAARYRRAVQRRWQGLDHARR